MPTPPTSPWNRCWRYCVDCLQSALAAGPPATPGRLRARIELTIRPSRAGWYVGLAFLLLCAVHAWQLQRRGALLPSAMVLLGAAATGWGGWQLLRGTGLASRTLWLYPDGRVGFPAEDAPEELRLAPHSLVLGSHVVLVFRGTGRRQFRLLLGPENLSASDRAALWRWLRRAPGMQGPGGAGTALDSRQQQ